MAHSPRICILLENATYPLDRRVSLETAALAEAGYAVTVVAPLREGQPTVERLGGVEVRRFPLRFADSIPGYLSEYSLALYHMLRILVSEALPNRFDAIHVCNPPDFLFLAVLPFMPLGTKLVFDHHDLFPEVFQARFSFPGAEIATRCLKLFEHLSVRLASMVLATNESYRRLVIQRHQLNPAKVQVVRTGPDLKVFSKVTPDPGLDQSPEFIVGYVGLMSEQDGVGILVDVAAELRRRGLSDFRFLLIGDGPGSPAIRAAIERQNLSEYFTLTGLIQNHGRVLSLLAACDVSVVPDPWTPANDISTFIKVLEYLGLGIPIVATNLTETRASTGDAAVYVEPSNATAMAEAILVLRRDPARREELSRRAKERLITHELAWDFQHQRLVAAYDRLLGRKRLRWRSAAHWRTSSSTTSRHPTLESG